VLHSFELIFITLMSSHIETQCLVAVCLDKICKCSHVSSADLRVHFHCLDPLGLGPLYSRLQNSTLNSLGLNPSENMRPHYVVSPGKANRG
jgi:hypothetical protein